MEEAQLEFCQISMIAQLIIGWCVYKGVVLGFHWDFEWSSCCKKIWENLMVDHLSLPAIYTCYTIVVKQSKFRKKKILLRAEGASQGCSLKNSLLKTLQNAQDNMKLGFMFFDINSE